MFTQASLEAVRAQYADATETVHAEIQTGAPAYVLHLAGLSVAEALRQADVDDAARTEVLKAAYDVLNGRLTALEAAFRSDEPEYQAVPPPMDAILTTWGKPISGLEYEESIERASQRLVPRSFAEAIRQPWHAGSAAAEAAYLEHIASNATTSTQFEAPMQGVEATMQPRQATD